MTTVSPQASSQTSQTSLDQSTELWQLFASATRADEFCVSWLGLIALKIPSLSLAAIMVESPNDQSFLPIAVWPAAGNQFARLSDIIKKTLTNKKMSVDVYNSSADIEDETQHIQAASLTQMAFPILVHDRTVGAVALELATQHADTVNHAVRQVHWGIAWLSELFMRKELEQLSTQVQQVGTVMETIAVALREGKLRHMLFEVVNHVARQQGFSRVAIGLEHGHHVQPKALSDNAWFNKNVALLQSYCAAMEACYDQRMPLLYPEIDASHIDQANLDSTSKHAGSLSDTIQNSGPSTLQTLAGDSGAQAILALPLLQGVRCVGVLTVEHDRRHFFTDQERAWLHALTGMLPSAIEQKKMAEQGYLARLRDDTQSVIRKLLGPRHLLWKAIAFSVSLASVIALIPIPYTVNAKTVVEGEIQRVIPAPFEGYLIAAFVRAGDTVKAGQVLARFDDKDLKVELAKAQSERNQYDRKLREAMANHELANIQVFSAQLQQAQAQYTLAEDKLRRSTILAPMDGMIVSGDLSQDINSPMEQGKKLFEMSPLDRYRVILQVDEQDIRQVNVGQIGFLLMTGLAHQPIDFIVRKVTPVASTDEGKNVFRVEAQLRSEDGRTLPNLRPGMEGIGKITTPAEPIGWILTHKLTDWLRLQFWSLIP